MNDNVTEHPEREQKANCEKIIRRSGVKVTKCRIAVMQCLATSSVSMSPREILEAIDNDKSSKVVDQVSIYRILETFQKLGLVHQVSPSGKFIACTHVNCQGELHVLVHCEKCLKTDEVDIPKEIFYPTQWYIKKNYGFTHPNNLFQLNGICSSCAYGQHRPTDINDISLAH